MSFSKYLSKYKQFVNGVVIFVKQNFRSHILLCFTVTFFQKF